MMLIVKSKERGWYKPRYQLDLPMFMHCCDGSIEVKDIDGFLPVFTNHGIQIMVQDETL